jgi:hypothetical protein
MRSQLGMSPSWNSLRSILERTCVHVDEHFIIVLEKDHARFALRADAHHFHRISEQLFCTGAFLDACVAAILHPSEGTSLRKIMAHIADGLGCTSYMLPAASGEMWLTLFEHIVSSLNIGALMARARAAVTNGTARTRNIAMREPAERDGVPPGVTACVTSFMHM